MTARPDAPPPLSLSRHISRSLRLAAPVMLGRAGLIVMITVDSVMTGRAGAEPLAHYAIGLAPHITLLVIGIGLMVGTVVLVAQADGAGREADCGSVWRTALVVAGAVGLLAGLIMLWGEGLLLLLAQGPDLAAGGGRALIMFAPGMPAVLMYMATTFFLEGLGRPYAGMIVALLANLPNAALNWVFIYGNLGMPEMGAAGAALATTIVRWGMLLALVGYVFSMSDGARYGLRGAVEPRAGMVRKLFRIGAPLSVAAGLEAACFTTVATFAGRLGEVPLAGYQIALNVITFVFMLAIGLSNATSVRVANAVGRGDRQGMATAGWTGFGIVVCMMVLIGGLIWLLQVQIAGVYIEEAMVLAVAVPALGVAAFIVVVDGVQAVVMGALRGTGDVLLPTLSQALSFWIIAVPLAYVFGLNGDAGVAGLLWSLFAGLACACLLLGLRFSIVARRGARPM
jgi:MATE family multidrug resistance protein